MSWDIAVAIANVLLTVGIIPQIIKNYITRNVESHCNFWHITTMIGFFILIAFYSYLNLWFAVTGLLVSVCLRLYLIWQIMSYR